MSIHEYFDHNIQSAVPLRLSRCLKLWVEPVLDIKAQLILGLVDVWVGYGTVSGTINDARTVGTINGTGTTFGVELFASKKKEIKRQTYFLVEKVIIMRVKEKRKRTNGENFQPIFNVRIFKSLHHHALSLLPFNHERLNIKILHSMNIE
uniref:Uncharacterized protein n=1 Tax=Rhizophagus irregularis (strain DAOM 181602 / DAOM 197198 / MUCL 43194) TaxID=747089 RepID=U9SZY7_RHIID